MKKLFIKVVAMLVLGFLLFYPGRFLVENPPKENRNAGIITFTIPEEEWKESVY